MSTQLAHQAPRTLVQNNPKAPSGALGRIRRAKPLRSSPRYSSGFARRLRLELAARAPVGTFWTSVLAPRIVEGPSAVVAYGSHVQQLLAQNLIILTMTVRLRDPRGTSNEAKTLAPAVVVRTCDAPMPPHCRRQIRDGRNFRSNDHHLGTKDTRHNCASGLLNI